MMRKLLKESGAYLVALAVFTLLACLYCRPQLEGKALQAGDNISARCAMQECVQYHKDTGDYSFWTGAMFSGMPNYQIGGYRYMSAKWLAPLHFLTTRGYHGAIAVLLLYLIGFYLCLHAFGVNKWLSIAGAIAIAFSSYFFIIIPAGHLTKTVSLPLMAMVAGGFHLIFRRRYAAGLCMVTVCTAMSFSVHPQMAYYLFMMIGLMYVGQLTVHLKEKRYKDLLVASLLFFGGVAIGIGTRTANVFANQEYLTETMRGGHSDLVKTKDAGNKTEGLDLDYATQWSYGWDEMLTFIVPGAKGGSSRYALDETSSTYQALVKRGQPKKAAREFCEGIPLYWGEQPFTSGGVYMGAVVCFLFLLGCFLVKGPYKWALVAATLFSFLLSLGHNFMPLTRLFFQYFPMYDKFRAVSSILVVAEIAMPVLGFMALQQMWDNRFDTSARKPMIWAASLSGGLCLVLALGAGALFSFQSSQDAQIASQLPSWLYDAILDDRRRCLVSDAWRSFLLIAVAFALLWGFTLPRVSRKGWFVPLLGLLVLVDMWPIDRRYFNDKDFVVPRNLEAAFALQPYEKQILQDKDPHFRVLNLSTSTFNDARTSYRLKSIGGYSAVKLRRYQDLIDEHLSKVELPVVSMLNGKYLILPDQSGQVKVQPNPMALGNAWFVDSLVVADNANRESDALREIDLSHVAVVGKDFEACLPATTPYKDDESQVRLTAYSPCCLDYEYQTAQAGTLVFSEVYYPHGWKATLDGQPVEHYRVNYLLRAVNVPAGQHRLHFEFRPDSVRHGDWLAMSCIILMYAILLACLGRWIYRRWKNQGLPSGAGTLMLLLLLLPQTACSGRTGRSDAGSGKTAKIAVIISTLNNPWFVLLGETGVQRCQELGYEVSLFDSQKDVAKEVENFDNVIAAGYDAIICNVVDADGSVVNVRNAINAGIPVFLVDREINAHNLATSAVLADSYAGCVEVGKAFIELLGKEGKYAEILGEMGDNNTWTRSNGFHSVIDRYTGWEMVAQQSADFDRVKAMEVLESMLQAHPEIQAVFCGNDVMALGAWQAVVSAGKQGQVKIFGFDGEAGVVKSIREGKITATAMQSPAQMATIAAEFADKYLQGERDFPHKIPLAVEAITLHNADKFLN